MIEHDPSPATIMLFKAAWDDDLDAVRTALDAGADVNHRGLENENGRDHVTTALHIAAASEQGADMLRLLIRHGAQIDALDSLGHTPLLICANCTLNRDEDVNMEILGALLEAGADATAKDAYGRTALHLATTNRPGERYVGLLLSARVDPSARDNAGYPPLSHAVRQLDTQIVRMLLDKGADANASGIGEKGKTVLDFLPGWSDTGFADDFVECLRLLLEAGSDPHQRNRQGVSAMDLAEKRPEAKAAIMAWKARKAASVAVRAARSRAGND